MKFLVVHVSKFPINSRLAQGSGKISVSARIPVAFVALIFAMIFIFSGVARADDHGNSYSSATSLSIEVASSGSIETAGDVDYFSFYATSGITYFILTSNLSSSCDTIIYLYDINGTTLIKFNDDWGVGFTSRIGWAAPSSGTYYIKVLHYSPYGTGTYSIEVTEEKPPVGGWLAGIKGGVYNSFTGKPITNGTIYVTDFFDDFNFAMLNGYYLGMLQPGTYSITASAVGYYPQSYSNVTLGRMDIETINFELDPKFDLSELISALQMLAGMENSLGEHGLDDINGDGRIGLEEIIYLLQIVSGLR